MQQNYPGTSVLQGGQRTKLTMEDLTQYYLSKMGTPEEYERKHPRSKFSKLFHEKESPVSAFASLLLFTFTTLTKSLLIYLWFCFCPICRPRDREDMQNIKLEI